MQLLAVSRFTLEIVSIRINTGSFGGFAACTLMQANARNGAENWQHLAAEWLWLLHSVRCLAVRCCQRLTWFVVSTKCTGCSAECPMLRVHNTDCPRSESSPPSVAVDLVRDFEWSLEPMFIRRDPHAAIECLKIAAAAGGRWRPTDPYQLRCLRKAIATVPEYSAVGYLRELIDSGAIEQDVFAELMKTPRMKQIFQGNIPGAVRLRELAGVRTGVSEIAKQGIGHGSQCLKPQSTGALRTLHPNDLPLEQRSSNS